MLLYCCIPYARASEIYLRMHSLDFLLIQSVDSKTRAYHFTCTTDVKCLVNEIFSRKNVDYSFNVKIFAG